MLATSRVRDRLVMKPLPRGGFSICMRVPEQGSGTHELPIAVLI